MRKLSLADINTFTQQLRSLIRSKVELLPALNILYEHTSKQEMRKVVYSLYEDVAKGRMLSESLSRFPQYFSPLYISIIRAGENAGQLEEALNQISAFLSSSEDLRRKIQTALLYPAFMLVMGVITLLVLFNFVVPRLNIIFKDFGQNLPLPTKILLRSSDFFRSIWFWLLVAGAGILVFRFTDLSSFKMRLPIFGRVLREGAIARFSRSFSLLLRGGVSIFDGLRIASPSLDDKQMVKEVEKVCEKVISGSSLSDSISCLSSFPAYFKRMLVVGEKGGRLEEVLNELAEDYERRVEAGFKMITSLIEPIIILILGIILGGIIIAMLLPIFEMSMLAK